MTATGPGTAGDLLAGALRAAGIDAIYGDPVPGLDTIPVPGGELAELLAATHRRVVGRRALVAVGGRLRTPGPGPEPSVVTSAEAIAALPARLVGAAAIAIDLDVDLTAPTTGLVPDSVPPIDHWVGAPDGLAERVAAAASPLVLAGPGVVASGAVPGLHALAAAGRLGVLNTWGAKGVFDWRSRHHLATVGLQDLDFELAGGTQADLLIAAGVDADEAPADRWQGAASVVVEPGSLSSLAEQLDRTGPWLEVPELRHRLAAVTQEGWADAGSPLAPTAATRNYGTVLGRGGRVSGDAGLVGFWVARTFSTVELGSAHVPATSIPGFAAAAALVSRLVAPARTVLAVVDGPPSDTTLELLALADSLGRGFAVEAWRDDGQHLAADEHLARLRRLAVVGRSEVVTLATARWQLDRIIEAAGPITAWGGIASRRT